MSRFVFSVLSLIVLFASFVTFTRADEKQSFMYLKNKGLFQSNIDLESIRPQGILRYEEGINWILYASGTSTAREFRTYSHKVNHASYLQYLELILERKMETPFKIYGGFRSELFIEFLFRANKIFPKKEDFLDATFIIRNNDNPYLALADLLNIKPSRKVLTRAMALDIVHRFLELQPYFLPDGYYGKIAAHEHYRAKGNLEDYFAIASALGYQKTIFLPTGMNPNNRGYEKHQVELLQMAKKYPDKIVAFCTIDEQDEAASQKIEECVKQGGRGLKLLGWHPEFYDEEFNSEKMMKIYQKVQELKLPVIFHASIINIDGLEAQIREVLGKFPDTTFVHAHYCSTVFNGVNLERCGKLLDDYPNLYIDATMGGGIPRYLGYFENPADLQETIDFIIKYQDRIMVSSDIILTKGDKKDKLYDRMICDARLQQNTKYKCPAVEQDKERNGFSLPAEVLRKIYYENPKRIFGL